MAATPGNKYNFVPKVTVNSGKSGGLSSSGGGADSNKPKDSSPPPKRVTGVEDSAVKPREPPPKEIRFSGASARPHPTYGFEINKPFLLDVIAEYIRKTSRRKISVNSMIPVVDGKASEDLRPLKNGVLDDAGRATIEIPLHIPAGYPGEHSGPVTHPITYKITVESTIQENPLQVEIEFTKEKCPQIPDLKRGMYDDEGIKVGGRKYPNGGEKHVAGTPIYELQKILEDLRYLPGKSADGIFGARTESAVKCFQEDSLGNKRLNRQTAKLVEVKRITFKGNKSGVVNGSTRDEVHLWKTENYRRPFPEIYHGDYDRKAVDAGVKPDDNDGYHEIGTPVFDLQKWLMDIGVYSGRHDGWAGDATKMAIERFQSHAEKGEFIDTNGKKVRLPEDDKLKGERKGIGTPQTQALAQKCANEGLKIPGTAAGSTPAAKKKITVDPGHGDHNDGNSQIDPGAVNGADYEKDIALNISNAINAELTSKGHTIVMTRTGDKQNAGKKLQWRIDAAAETDIFISIHVNSATNTKASGFGVCYKKGDKESKSLADCINRSNTQFANQGLSERSDLFVLNNFGGVAGLVEAGFISNSSDLSIMKTRAAEIGREIAVGVLSYLGGTGSED